MYSGLISHYGLDNLVPVVESGVRIQDADFLFNRLREMRYNGLEQHTERDLEILFVHVGCEKNNGRWIYEKEQTKSSQLK